MIEQIIRDTYYRHRTARAPKLSSASISKPEEDNYGPSEVSWLIDDIVKNCNAQLAELYFKKG